MKELLDLQAPRLRLARVLAVVSSCFCFLALLCILDGLQALMRADFNQIDLAVGETVPMSGAMPLEAKEHTQILWDIDGDPGLHFTPKTSFKGFWLGAFMWRGELSAAPGTEPGPATLTIVDMVPAKSTTTNATITVQNPSQIYHITVWPTEAALQGGQLSLGKRLTGYSGLVLAGGAVLLGILTGAAHAFHLHRVQRAFAARQIFFLIGVQKRADGFRAAFSPEGREGDLRVGLHVDLIDMQGGTRGRGTITECGPKKYAALFPPDGVMPGHNLLMRVPEE